MSAERRWTISGAVMARNETGERYVNFPRIVPSLDQNESVEVMPVSEHEAVRAALVEAAAVFETLGYEQHAADALAALGGGS